MNMITDINDRPKVNALAPHVQQPRGALNKSMPNARPSVINAVTDNKEFKMVNNFVEQNKNTKGGSKVAAAHRKDYNTGKLPSLGLSKYQANDFSDDTRNPFTVQPNTEKMLVMRELEREFRDLNKY